MSSLICSEEIAYSEIKQRILDGRLPPGARLVHRTLAAECGVSQNPVMLALRMLERDGLVTNTPGLGAAVRRWSHQDIVDLHEIRAVNEGLAARLCSQRASSSDVEAIMAANDEFVETVDAGDAEGSIRADVALHSAIVCGAHCIDMDRLNDSLSIMQCSMKFFGLHLGLPRSLHESARTVHKPLIEAIMSRDAIKAEALANQHVQDALGWNLTLVEKMAALSSRRTLVRVREFGVEQSESTSDAK